MRYDRALTVCTLPSGTPLKGSLQPVFSRLCGELNVYNSRFWNAVQAGSRIDKLLQLPRIPGEIVEAEHYCIAGDGHVYRIEQAEEAFDEDLNPVWRLSLRRMEANYDLCKPAPDP